MPAPQTFTMQNPWEGATITTHSMELDDTLLSYRQNPPLGGITLGALQRARELLERNNVPNPTPVFADPRSVSFSNFDEPYEGGGKVPKGSFDRHSTDAHGVVSWLVKFELEGVVLYNEVIEGDKAATKTYRRLERMFKES